MMIKAFFDQDLFVFSFFYMKNLSQLWYLRMEVVRSKKDFSLFQQKYLSNLLEEMDICKELHLLTLVWIIVLSARGEAIVDTGKYQSTKDWLITCLFDYH